MPTAPPYRRPISPMDILCLRHDIARPLRNHAPPADFFEAPCMSSLAHRAAARLRTPSPTAATAVDPDTALLQLAGKVGGEHALIIGPHALELMCALLRRG